MFEIVWIGLMVVIDIYIVGCMFVVFMLDLFICNGCYVDGLFEDDLVLKIYDFYGWLLCRVIDFDLW